MTATTIIQAIVTSFTTFMSGIGTSIQALFEDVFTNADGGLSVIAIVALTLLGLGLAFNIVKWILAKF